MQTNTIKEGFELENNYVGESLIHPTYGQMKIIQQEKYYFITQDNHYLRYDYLNQIRYHFVDKNVDEKFKKELLRLK